MSTAEAHGDRERSIDRAHAVIREFVRSASSAAGEDPRALVALLRHTLPAHFAYEERPHGFFDRLASRGVSVLLLDRLKADHREFLDRLERLEEAIERGDPIDTEIVAIAERLGEHEWIESATAAQLGEHAPADLPAEPAPAARALPSATAGALDELAERCRALAAHRRGELLAAVTVAVPDTVSSEGVRSSFERALAERGLTFVELCLCPGSEIALRGVRFRRVP